MDELIKDVVIRILENNRELGLKCTPCQGHDN